MSHKTDVQIRFNDVDILGHVNNAVYQYYFDLARVNYFTDVLGEHEADFHAEALIVASIKVDYIMPVFLKDKIYVTTKITTIGNKSLTMTQEVFDEKKQLKASSETRMVAYSTKEQSTKSIPERWKISISNFEKDVTFKYLLGS